MNGMPGELVHLVAGSAMFIIGRYYFKSYFDGDDKTKERYFLALACLFFSCIPDFVLIIYYTTHILPFDTMWPYQTLVNILFVPIAIVALLTLKYLVNIKRKPIWIMGMWCILLHITMDLFVPDSSISSIWI